MIQHRDQFRTGVGMVALEMRAAQPMRLDVNVQPTSTAALREFAAAALQANATCFGTWDTVSARQDPRDTGKQDDPFLYWPLALAAIADATDPMIIGPNVTNPVTMPPDTMARCVQSLDLITNGRGRVLFGKGDSGVTNLGREPATVKGTIAFINAVRELLETGETWWDGRHLSMQKSERKIPIYLAASGPVMIRAAGHLGVGLIAAGGISPDAIANTLRLYNEGAHKRNPNVAPKPDIWWNPAVVDVLPVDADRSAPAMTWTVAQACHHYANVRESGFIPELYRPYIKRLAASYPIQHHGHIEDRPDIQRRILTVFNRMPKEIQDYLLGRCCLLGPHEILVHKTLPYLYLQGVTNISIAGLGDVGRVLRFGAAVQEFNNLVLPQLPAGVPEPGPYDEIH